MLKSTYKFSAKYMEAFDGPLSLPISDNFPSSILNNSIA